MKITSIQKQKKNKERFSIYVDGTYSFSMDEIDVAKIGLFEGQDITQNQIEHYKDIYEYKKAKDRALRFISKTRKTQYEVFKKLKDSGYSEDIICKVITLLKDYKYIDDQEYAECFIKEKLKFNPKGKKLLKLELKAKGIDDDIIIEKLENMDIDEYEDAYKLALKKVSNIENIDRFELNKIYNFLARKGFSTDIIINVIKNIKK